MRLTTVVPRRAGRHGDQFGSRCHDLARGQVGESEDAVEHLFFVLLENAGFLAGGDEHLQLFFRVNDRAAFAAAKADQPDERLRRPVQQPYERPQRAHEQFERPDDPQRRRLRALERDPLWRELSKDDLQGRDHRERDRDGDAVDGGRREIGGSHRNAGSMYEASAGSAIHPRPRLAIVIPTWVAAM